MIKNIAIFSLFCLSWIFMLGAMSRGEAYDKVNKENTRLGMELRYKDKQLDSCQRLSDYLNSDKIVLMKGKIVYK